MNGPKEGGEQTEPSSPVCHAGDADAAYMGFADRAELAAFLGELRDAERSIVDRLRAILPRIRDDALHADVAEMLRVHEADVARAEALVERQRR